MAPNAHSPLGASSSHRWLNCPGSIALSRGIPRQTSTYAAEGTAAHQLAETCLTKGQNAVEYLGAEIIADGARYEVTDEMAEAVQLYLDTIRADQAAMVGAELSVERKFDLDWLYPDLYGTNDACLGEAWGLVRIYDYKHGAGVPVDAAHNSQLMYYALGAIHGQTYEEVEIVVIQPRARHVDGHVRRWRVSVEALMDWANSVLLPGAKATEKDEAPLKQGDHCRFCPALAVCPEMRRQVQTVAKSVFSGPRALPTKGTPVLPNPEHLSPDEIAKIMAMADIVEKWIGAVQGHARALLEQGTPVPGWKLVQGRASRKWADEKQAKGVLLSVLKQDAFKLDLLSPAQAEKAYRAYGLDPKALDQLIVTTRGITMAPEHDSREAVQRITAAQAFSN